MLVLTRRVNEKLVISGEIVVTVLGVGRNGQVRLGIDAPAQVQIFRHEIWQEIQAENRMAADPSAVANADVLGSLLTGTIPAPTSSLEQE